MAGHQVCLAAFLIIYSLIHYLYLSAGSLAAACTHHFNNSIHPTPHNPHAACTAGQTDAEPAWLCFLVLHGKPLIPHVCTSAHAQFLNPSLPQPQTSLPPPSPHPEYAPTNDFCPRPLLSTMRPLLMLAGKCPTPTLSFQLWPPTPHSTHLPHLKHAPPW